MAAPCVLVFEQLDLIIDVLGRSTNVAGYAVDFPVSQLVGCIDALSANSRVLIIATTSRPDQVDPALIRFGRLDQLIHIPLPDQFWRSRILSTILMKCPLAPDDIIDFIAEHTAGSSCANLNKICQFAVKDAVRDSVDADSLQASVKYAEQDPYDSDVDSVIDAVPYITRFVYLLQLLMITEELPSGSTSRKQYGNVIVRCPHRTSGVMRCSNKYVTKSEDNDNNISHSLWSQQFRGSWNDFRFPEETSLSMQAQLRLFQAEKGLGARWKWSDVVPYRIKKNLSSKEVERQW